jgi:pyrroline-5-carboxylate reductase
LVGFGAAGIAKGPNAKPEDLQLAMDIFSAVGTACAVPEKNLDAITALSGSGPAYVFEFIQALADGGVAEGLSRKDALLLAAQTVAGAAKMVLETGKHPGALKDAVCSPGGSTIQGVRALEENGFRTAAFEAVIAAYNKTKELGKA